jgi:predicted PurR-regulated permease PerM
VLLLVAIVLGIWLVVQLQNLLVQVMLALIVAAAVNPIVDRVQAHPLVRGRRWVPGRALIVILIYVVVFCIVGVLFILIGAGLAAQLSELRAALPTYVAELDARLSDLATRLNLSADQAAALNGQIDNLIGRFGDAFAGLLQIVGALFSVFGGILNIIFTLIIAIYFASDGERICRFTVSFLPLNQQVRAARVIHTTSNRLGAWIRGQLAVSSIVSVLFGVGLSIIGVPSAAVLGVVAFIGEFVPLIGPFVSSVPAIIVAFLTTTPEQTLLTIAFCVVVQQLENNLIVPKVMSTATTLHPLAVMLVILAGGQLMGAAGAILAVPIAGFGAVLLHELHGQAGHSSPALLADVALDGLDERPLIPR